MGAKFLPAPVGLWFFIRKWFYEFFYWRLSSITYENGYFGKVLSLWLCFFLYEEEIIIRHLCKFYIILYGTVCPLIVFFFCKVYNVANSCAKTSLKIASCHGTLDNKEKASTYNSGATPPNDWIHKSSLVDQKWLCDDITIGCLPPRFAIVNFSQKMFTLPSSILIPIC